MTTVCTDLPQGTSSVVLSWKMFSKLYRLRTSSLSVSSSIQPLKLGRASWEGGYKRNKRIKIKNCIWFQFTSTQSSRKSVTSLKKCFMFFKLSFYFCLSLLQGSFFYLTSLEFVSSGPLLNIFAVYPTSMYTQPRCYPTLMTGLLAYR